MWQLSLGNKRKSTRTLERSSVGKRDIRDNILFRDVGHVVNLFSLIKKILDVSSQYRPFRVDIASTFDYGKGRHA